MVSGEGMRGSKQEKQTERESAASDKVLYQVDKDPIKW